MSSRPVLAPYKAIDAASMGASITSDVSLIPNISMCSYSYSWSGTSPVGTVTVQVSNDYVQAANGDVLNAGTWNTLELSAAAAVSGNTGNGYIDIDQISAQAIRTIYTRTSGTGSLTAILKGKVS